MDKNKVNIVDVAKKAGVSIATVSRVLNGSDLVKDDTREKVQKVIDYLQYIPHAVAREIQSRNFMTIGVVVPSVYNMFFAEVLDGIEDYLRNNSYFLMLNCAKNNSELEVKAIRTMIERKVSGIIVLSPNTQEVDSDFYKEVIQDTPIVFVNAYNYVQGASYVGNDEELGTQEAIRYLFSLGHKKILFVRGVNSDSYEIKEDAFREIMKSENLDAKSYVVTIEGGNSMETAELSIDALLEILPKTDATAIFCCNDLMAVGALNACKLLEKNVPGDISVMGYDNTSIANIVTPKITSVDQNMFQLGRNAAQMLIEKIETGQVKRVTLYNTIVERDSTGPVRGQ